MQALIGARLQEEPSAFGKWCVVRGVRSLPAAPAHVAAFLADNSGLGKPVKKIWELVHEISRDHVANGYADPTAGGVVGEMINSISMIEAPRSWPKAEKLLFKALPYDLQVFFAAHDRLREKEISRAYSEAAAARQALAAIEKPEEAKHGIHQSQIAAA